jgi:hypothetical protein
MASGSGLGGVPGTAVAAAAAGAVLVWSGVKGTSVTGTLRSLISGKAPPAGQSSPIGTPSAEPGITGAVPGVQSSALPSAGTYDHAQLAALWIQGGGSAAAANNAACHALQESSGNPQATSANPDGGTNVGLWQLDTHGKGAGYSVTALQNALNNARITVMATRNGADWSAWATPGC